MIGRNPGWVTTQGERLGDLLETEGYPVISVSSSTNRYIRLADIAYTLIRRRKEIDILLLQVFGGPSFVVEDIASWLSQLFGHRIVMVLRGGAMPDFMARHSAWNRRVLSRADLLITPSTYLKRAIAPYGFEARVIPNVIDLSAYQYRHRATLSPRLLWMRSFHPIYNPLMALRVLAQLKTEVPEATLVMAGQDKGQEPEVRAFAKTLGLNGAVRFSGFLDMAGKMREANAADIFINTNSIDNMPVAVVEACALGLPVVSTDIGGVPDLLTDGETGLLVPDNDVRAMADGICRLLREPALASRLSEKGREVAAQSSWDLVGPQWEAVISELSRYRRQ
jgi:glycosyltransferase involved in cell wall biosynthesis